MELQSVTCLKPVWIRAGNVTQLMAPAEIKEPMENSDKMVKLTMFNSPLMALIESAEKVLSFVALEMIKSP